jgi:hypothetical protein
MTQVMASSHSAGHQRRWSEASIDAFLALHRTPSPAPARITDSRVEPKEEAARSVQITCGSVWKPTAAAFYHESHAGGNQPSQMAFDLWPAICYSQAMTTISGVVLRASLA